VALTAEFPLKRGDLQTNKTTASRWRSEGCDRPEPNQSACRLEL